MLLTEMLARNARVYPHEVSLIEREPAIDRRREITDWNLNNKLIV